MQPSSSQCCLHLGQGMGMVAGESPVLGVMAWRTFPLPSPGQWSTNRME
jgi:hypothetical protein